jgi:methylase of polypeptide subunit release factors
MIKLTDLYHRIIQDKKHINLSVDMTCGHGRDTLFLSKLSKKVYAFDIQAKAIDDTKKLLENQDNVIIIQDDHQYFDQYIKEPIDVAIYNLGYLPGGNKDIITETASTLASLEKICHQLNKDGLIILELYPHNPDEQSQIIQYTKSLSKSFDVLKIDLHNSHQAPNLIIIKKSAE